MTNWTKLTRRTEDPKLRYIEYRLDLMGIPHQRNGESFHAPILEVPYEHHQRAWDLLSETTLVDGEVLDNLDDRHPAFDPWREPGDDCWDDEDDEADEADED